MERLRIFLSSTCYDLKRERALLKKLILQLGHEPILSDENHIRYDPAVNAHVNCLEKVENGTDYFIMLVSSRFGGHVISDSFIEHIKVDILKDKSSHKDYFKNCKYSISQCEALKAIELDIPYLIFVQKDISDKRKEYLDAIKQKNNLVIEKYKKKPDIIANFDFITYVNRLYNGNGVYEYSSLTTVRKTIIESLSDHLRTILSNERRANKVFYPQCISDNYQRLNLKIFEKLVDDYQGQRSSITIHNRQVFDKHLNCDYDLKVKITPITECPLYYMQIIPDKIGRLKIHSFINLDNRTESKSIVFRTEKEFHLFLFNNSVNLKLPFTVELKAQIESHHSNLIKNGSTYIAKTLIGKNTNYNQIVQQLYFPSKFFKNIKVICTKHPVPNKVNKKLTPQNRTLDKKKYLVYEIKVTKEVIKNCDSPDIRYDIQRIK